MKTRPAPSGGFRPCTGIGIPDLHLVTAFLLLLLPAFSAPPSLTAEQTLSVLYFESLDRNADYLWMEKGIADTLITELSGIDGLVLVERERLQKIIDEQRFQMSGLTDESTAVEIGNLLNAETLVLGSYAVSGGKLLVTCRLVETETGKVGSGFSEEGAVDQYLSIQRTLAWRICESLGFTKGSPLLPAGSPSLQAYSYYYRGLDLYDRAEYSQAADLMRKAIDSAPGFDKPSRTLEECYRFLQDFRQARQLRELNRMYAELDRLFIRLNRVPFLTYRELITRAAAAGEDVQALTEKLKEDLSWFRGDTPAQVLWNAQLIMVQIGMKLDNEFGDPEGGAVQYRRMIAAAGIAAERFADDPWLPEIIYQEVLAYYMLRDWTALEKGCVEFMTRWPDFRMISAVEDFYEKALENR